MKLCGKDGEELRCCKTGLTIHDQTFHPDSRHQADLYFCPVCHSLLIERCDREYMSEGLYAQLVIRTDKTLKWDQMFVDSVKLQYGVNLCP